MDLLLQMLRDEPNAVIGAVVAALAAACVLLWDLVDDEDPDEWDAPTAAAGTTTR